MLTRISKQWVDWLLKNGANPRDRQVFEYGAECVLSEVIANAVVYSIAFLLEFPLEMLVWQLFWLPLRLCIGGFHASRNHLTCTIISTAIAVGSVFLAPFIATVKMIALPATVLSAITVFSIAPVLHPNHPITEKHKQKMHRNGKIIFILEIIIITILYVLRFTILAGTAMLGMFAAAFLCWIGKFTNNSNK